VSDLRLVANVPQLTWVDPGPNRHIDECDLTRPWEASAFEYDAIAKEVGRLVIQPRLDPRFIGEAPTMFLANTGEVLIHVKVPLEVARQRLPLILNNEVVHTDQPRSWNMFGIALGLGIRARAMLVEEGVAVAVRPLTRTAYDKIVAARQGDPPRSSRMRSAR
jgi:hypothetical protein